MVSEKAFANPPVSSRIKPFWFWNGTMTREEISHQIKEMADKGLGGMFICRIFLVNGLSWWILPAEKQNGMAWRPGYMTNILIPAV